MPEEKTWTLWLCPKCGEPAEVVLRPGTDGHAHGHYHDNPDNRFHRRIFHPAEEVVLTRRERLAEVEADREKLRKALEADQPTAPACETCGGSGFEYPIADGGTSRDCPDCSPPLEAEGEGRTGFLFGCASGKHMNDGRCSCTPGRHVKEQS
jgi:predicted RNA-binding Zn-ribbon protein involved in translation (DUF1610 family)